MRRLGLAVALLPLAVFADVEFTSPAAGDHVAVGTINVQWKESGTAPFIKDLTAYTLLLVVGGNDEKDQLPIATFVSPGTFSSGNKAQGTIPAGIAGPVPNGFFFKIMSSSSAGEVINYSDRFSITGLTGTTLFQYREAAEALNGSTAGPGSVGDSAGSTTTSVASASATTSQRSGPTYTNTLVTVTTKTPSSTTPPQTTSTSPSNSQDGGLSTSVLVGIAIAGVAIGLIGIALAVWAFLRKKRRREHGPVKLDDSSGSFEDVARKEMSVAEPVELDPYSRIVEADNGLQRPEMDSTNIRAELEGDHIHIGGLKEFEEPLTPVPETPIENLTLTSLDHFAMSTDTLATMATPVTPRSNV